MKCHDILFEFSQNPFKQAKIRGKGGIKKIWTQLDTIKFSEYLMEIPFRESHSGEPRKQSSPSVPPADVRNIRDEILTIKRIPMSQGAG